MGLDEKAIEAVRNWRFRPATLNGQTVATQIAVQVDFHEAKAKHTGATSVDVWQHGQTRAG
jgi:hypothetical protein